MDISEEMVRRISLGDEEAFSDLFQATWKHAVRTCWLILRNKHDAEETAQEAFLKLYLHRTQLREVGGVSAYIGNGSNRWTAVHRVDAAHLFRLALEKAPAGSHLDGVADEGVQFRDIASVIGKHLNLPVVSIPSEEADAHFGFLGTIAALDIPRSSVQTQELLGWNPVRPGLIADLEQGHYFNHR